jgi:putative toxin-antitoxin system antitoxin component (TIGR02293 family)
MTGAMKKLKGPEAKSLLAKNTKITEISTQYKAAPKALVNKVITKDFLFSDFKKISDRAPFTVADWAGILHISERTLHRYAQENAAFSGMQIERILIMEKLIVIGTQMFGKEGFKKWLKFKPFSLQFQTPISLLKTYEGIQQVIQLLSRMQHGIIA